MKKLFVLIIVSFILLFSFSIVVAAEPFPNSVVNLLNHKTFRSGSSYGVSFQFNGNYYILNGTATSDIKFPVTTCNLSNFVADQLYILYGGTDNSQVSLLCSAKSLDFRSSNVPSIFSLSKGSYAFTSYIFVSKGTVLENVKVEPVFAEFNYTVYNYGTNISNQTDIYYNDGYSIGYNSGKAEGVTEGYNSGKAEGITEGYNSGKAEGYELGSLNGEKVGYIDGYKSGYTNYKLSTEYKSALENKYSSGFKEGVASVEQEESDMTLAILIPSIVIECILGIFLTVFLSRKKQRRKNK